MKKSIFLFSILTFANLAWSMQQEEDNSPISIGSMELLPYQFDVIVNDLVETINCQKAQNLTEIKVDYNPFIQFIDNNRSFVTTNTESYPGPFDCIISLVFITNDTDIRKHLFCLMYILLKYGANIDSTNSLLGNTPLYSSILYEDLDLCKWLLEHNANIFAGTLKGKSIFHILRKERPEFVDLVSLKYPAIKKLLYDLTEEYNQLRSL